MADIFISYKREERPTALKLATALESAGWTVWWDLELVGGEHFDDTIQAELDDARCVVVLWSKRSVKSDFVKDEATYALNQHKLLPALIDDARVPLRFQRLHTINFVGWGGATDGAEFEELIEHITRRIGTPSRVTEEGDAPLGSEGEPSEIHPAQTPEPRKVSRRNFLGLEPTRSTLWGVWSWIFVGVVAAVLVGGVWWYQTGPERHAELQAELKRKEAKQRKAGTVFRDTLRDGSQGPEMVVVPAGSFMMGSPETEKGRDDDEGPQRRVTVGKFAMGKYEVTFEEYDKFAKATGRKLPEDSGWGRGTRPVIYASWEDAVAYAAWLSEQTGKRYRLPSEGKWEYAARAGTQTAFWWGPVSGNNRANCNGCGSKWDNTTSAPVGAFEANAFGLFDTAGNVFEWVQDCWHDSYEGGPTDGAAWETGQCSERVIRGGSWDNFPEYMRSADRDAGWPGGRGYYIGFRLAQDFD